MKLTARLEELAKRYNVEVTIGGGGSNFEIELLAPFGYCFEEETHSLISATWGLEPPPAIYRAAINDLENYGPHIQKCHDDCPCKEID